MGKATFQRFIQGILVFAMIQLVIFAFVLALPTYPLKFIFGFSVVAIAFSLGFSGGLMTIIFTAILKFKAGAQLETYNILQLVVATMVLAYTSWRIYLAGDAETWYFAFACCALPVLAAYIPYLIVKAQGGLPEQKLGQN